MKECAESIVQSARNAAVKGVQTTLCSDRSSVHKHKTLRHIAKLKLKRRVAKHGILARGT
eukprot:scaffold25129_cov71-Skeletonema_marinoi.AAC.1